MEYRSETRMGDYTEEIQITGEADDIIKVLEFMARLEAERELEAVIENDVTDVKETAAALEEMVRLNRLSGKRCEA